MFGKAKTPKSQHRQAIGVSKDLRPLLLLYIHLLVPEPGSSDVKTTKLQEGERSDAPSQSHV